MKKVKRIFIVADVGYNPVKMFLNATRKLAKGFIRLGHDVEIFSYSGAFRELSPLKSKTFSAKFFKSRVDRLLSDQIRYYGPDLICTSFAKILNSDTVEQMKQAAPNAVIIGGDGDPWPELHPRKLEIAKKLDILTATNDGQFLQTFRDAGAKHCVFMPNMCDPDIDHRYEVGPEWKTDILWTGKARHSANPSELFRENFVKKLALQKKCTLYGCYGRPKIGGIDYLYAISGARIGVNINAANDVRLYHSDRLTHYLACGTFVLAKKVPDTDLLFRDKQHLKYFDSVDEFFELADWYLNHEDQRKKIANAGMKWTHEQFNSVKIAGYILDLAETGSYKAPWFGYQ